MKTIIPMMNNEHVAWFIDTHPRVVAVAATLPLLAAFHPGLQELTTAQNVDAEFLIAPPDNLSHALRYDVIDADTLFVGNGAVLSRHRPPPKHTWWIEALAAMAPEVRKQRTEAATPHWMQGLASLAKIETPSPQDNLWDIAGVPVAATRDAIKRAQRQFKLDFHPDRVDPSGNLLSEAVKQLIATEYHARADAFEQLLALHDGWQRAFAAARRDDSL